MNDCIKFGVNRKVEDEQILEYQRTGDYSILDKVYKNRIQTFRFLASRYHYVCEDIESEIKCIFIKAIGKYKKDKKSFNTYFYTSVINHVRNMIKGKCRKKRTVVNNESNPESIFVRFDETIDDGGEGATYHDVIPDLNKDWINNVDIVQIKNYLSGRSWILEDFFIDLIKGACSPSRRRDYSGSVILNGMTPEKAIAKDVGIPKKLYVINGFSVSDDVMTYCVAVSSKRCIEMVRSIVGEMISIRG